MKRRITLIVITVVLVISAALLGNMILSRITHPAFTHADYVYGDRMVIDNETPFEYDESLISPYDRASWLATSEDGEYYAIWYDLVLEVSTWKKTQAILGNKILREKNGIYYTVYSGYDNQVVYVIFEPNERGTLILSEFVFHDSVHQVVDYWTELFYEQDHPKAILGDRRPPPETITVADALDKAEGFQNDLYSLRYNLQIDTLQELMLQEEIAQTYRMTINTAFDGIYLFDFYVYTDGTGSLIYRRYNSEEGLYNKGLFNYVTYLITQEETDSLLSVWQEADFFQLSPVHPHDTALIMDGQHIYLEGMDDIWQVEEEGVIFWNYHMIGLRDCNLIYPEFYAIHDALIALVEAKGTEVRFNYRHEEEELRKNTPS